MWHVTDDQIDDVARALTAAPAPRDLRARVIDRIDRRARVRSRRLVWALPVVAAAIVAVFALRGGWHRAPQTPPIDVQLTSRSAHPTVSPPGAAPSVSASAAIDDGARRPLAIPRPPRAAPASQVAPIEEITLAPLAADRVELIAIPAPVVVEPKPLVLAALAVAPLGAEDRQQVRP